MCCGDDVRTRRMHLGVDGKGRGIHGILAFHHLAAMIHQDQVRDADLAEVHPERIHPEVIPAFWIAGGDVACHSFVEAEAGKEPEGSGKRSEEHTSELQSLAYLVCRLLLEKKKKAKQHI